MLTIAPADGSVPAGGSPAPALGKYTPTPPPQPTVLARQPPTRSGIVEPPRSVAHIDITMPLAAMLRTLANDHTLPVVDTLWKTFRLPLDVVACVPTMM